MLYISLTAKSSIKKDLLTSKRVNILLMGISETDNAKFAEVIKVLSYEPLTGFLDIISLPRDTIIPVPYKVTWKRIMKLDEVYSRYYRKYKQHEVLFDKFINTVETKLNSRFSIDYYIQVDYTAFIDFINALGGVEIEVMNSFNYDDNAQDLHIHISSGVHVLGGADALKYVRYRDKIRGDMGRQERQHKFLNIIMQRMKKIDMLWKLPRIIRSIKDNVETNLSVSDLIVLVDEFRNYRQDNFRIQTLPGEPIIKWSKSYWKTDDKAEEEMIDVVLNSELINLPELKVDKSIKSDIRITAEVWNATNVPNLARELTDYLRKRNIDVVRYGNYGSNKKYTQIISRTGDLNTARSIARILGCRNIKTELDTSRMVEVNVVIGGDFEPIWKD